MKKIITVTLCIVLVLLFAGCGKNGDTSKVEIDYGASSVYSKEEIDSAIEIIKKQFASFEGCELHMVQKEPQIYFFQRMKVQAESLPMHRQIYRSSAYSGKLCITGERSRGFRAA